MKYFIVAVFALITPCLARPQAPDAHLLAAQAHPQQSGSATTPATIISQSDVVGPDGSFNTSYETSNGIRFDQDGYVKKAAEAKSVDPNNPDDTGDIQVIQGTYSYTAPDGQQISLRYIADDNGFQPEGDHLPKAPAVPEAIARSLEQQPQDQTHPLQQQAQVQPLLHPQAQVQPLLRPQEQAATTSGATLSPVTHQA